MTLWNRSAVSAWSTSVAIWRMSTGCRISVSSFSRLSRWRNSRKVSLQYCCVFMSFTCGGPTRLLRCSREIRPTAARDQRTFLIVNIGFGGGELTPYAQHLPLSRKVARHGCLVIVHSDIDSGHGAADFGRDCKVCRHIHDRSKNSPMRVPALGVHHPLVAPAGLDLDAVLACVDHRKVEPLVEGPA